MQGVGPWFSAFVRAAPTAVGLGHRRHPAYAGGMWTVWLCGVAAAETSAPAEGGFVSLPRTDAPTDGVPLYWSNTLNPIDATDATGTTTLSTTHATGFGPDQIVAVVPPEDGWVPGTSYTLSTTLDPGDVGPNPTTLTFEVGTAPAAAPLAPTVDDVRYGEWFDGYALPWECCVTAHTVEIDVTSSDPDVWAWIDVVGRF